MAAQEVGGAWWTVLLKNVKAGDMCCSKVKKMYDFEWNIYLHF